MMNDSLLIGMGQQLVIPGAPEENLRRAETMIAQAAELNCKIIVLPECLDLGWLDPSMDTLAQPIPGKYSSRLADAARKHGIYVAAGLTEQDDNRFYNSAVLIDDQGDILLLHRKINELRFGAPHDRYSIGDRLMVAETPFGCIGLLICADAFAPAISETLTRMGAQLILSPCAWAVPPDFDPQKKKYGQEWLDAYSPLTSTFDMTMIGVSYVGEVPNGPWAGWRCIGNSLAMGPGAQVLALGPHGIDAEALLTISVTLTDRPETGTQIDNMLKHKGV